VPRLGKFCTLWVEFSILRPVLVNQSQEQSHMGDKLIEIVQYMREKAEWWVVPHRLCGTCTLVEVPYICANL
jgi:hypothetical protein